MTTLRNTSLFSNNMLELKNNYLKASRLATSPLAKFIFDKNQFQNFIALFQTFPPLVLVNKLNQLTLSDAIFSQFKIITNKQEDFPLLFNLPVNQWFDILTQQLILVEDLYGLIGSNDSFEGAVSGMIDTIKEITDPTLKAWIFHYLLHYHDTSKAGIDNFLTTLNLPKNQAFDLFKESFIDLYSIINNATQKKTFPDGTSETYAAMERILRIKPSEICISLSDTKEKNPEDHFEKIIKNNLLRIESAILLIKTCIKYEYEKLKSQFTNKDQNKIEQFQMKLDELYCIGLQNAEHQSPPASPENNDLMRFLDDLNMVVPILEDEEQIYLVNFMGR